MVSSILGILGFSMITAGPVIRLDEVIVEGSVRRPPVVELRASRAKELAEEMALKNLIRLETKLLKPRSFFTPMNETDSRNPTKSLK